MNPGGPSARGEKRGQGRRVAEMGRTTDGSGGAAVADGGGDGRGLSLAKPALRVARVGT